MQWHQPNGSEVQFIMDKTYEELRSEVFALHRERKADLLDYLCISIVYEEWRYRTRGKPNEALILAVLALDLENRTDLRDKLMAEPDFEIEQYWIEECKRRMEGFDRGEMTTVSAEESIVHARRLIEDYKKAHS